ncbi:MAG: T9SS type A sorting domain-containing protein [Bacteroidetes bacterium]|nr:MAG: T9SS type A sorting domain-containing protein [Bacteroidota bacterium]
MKKLIYALLAIILFATSGLYSQKRVYFNTIHKQIVSNENLNLKDIHSLSVSKAPIEKSMTGDIDYSLPEFLVLTPERTLVNMVRTGGFRQDDDSSYGYPAYDPNNPNKPRTLAALSYFPLTINPDPNEPGVIHGIAQFIPPLPGTFDIDTIFLDFFVPKDWKPFTKELYVMPITYDKINLNDTNALRQVENRGGMLFDINDDKSYTQLLPQQQVVTISVDSINNRWVDDNRYRFLQLYFIPPLHVEQGKALGILIFNPEVNVSKDSIVFPAHLEWGISSKYYTYGYVISRKTGKTDDSVWLPYRYGYYPPLWGPGTENTKKWPSLTNMPLMQDYDFTFFGIYDAPDNVTEDSNVPSQFNLEQNSPNPAEDNTDIRFSTFNPEFVNLSVYNLSGELVIELINKTLNPGTYTATLNTSTLPSGTYIYKLQAGSQLISKMLNVVR